MADKPRLNQADRQRLDRIRRNEQMEPSVVRNLVRRKIVRRIDAIPPYEKVEWNRVVARFYSYEIIDPRLKEEK